MRNPDAAVSEPLRLSSRGHGRSGGPVTFESCSCYLGWREGACAVAVGQGDLGETKSSQ
jgi:hypothetical protein